jgi:type I restriction enzyme S subunit
MEIDNLFLMKRYDKYKPSGIDWIGDIPEHWTVATVGRVTNLGRGRVISNLEIGENPGEFPVYSSQTENNGVMGHLATYDFDGEYVTWTTDGANAGTVFHRTGKFNCTNVCGTMQPKNWEQLDLRFMPYFLNLGTKYSVRLDINPKIDE